MKNHLKARTVRLIVMAVAGISLASLTVGECFTHLFNTTLDASIAQRVVYTLRPSVHILGIVAAVIYCIVISLLLGPIFTFMEATPVDRTEELRGRARRAVIRLPWVLIVMTTGFWIAGTLVFYAMNGWKAPGGSPLAWVLSFKITEGLLSSILSALVVGIVLAPAKRLLGIHEIREGEHDRFIELKTYMIGFAGVASLISHLAYVTRYFLYRNPDWKGPALYVPWMIGVGAVFSIMIFLLDYVSNREDKLQLSLLETKLSELAREGNADLTRKIEVMSFDARGRAVSAFNAYLGTLSDMVTDIRSAAVSLGSGSKELGDKVGIVDADLEAIARSVDQVGRNMEDEYASIHRADASVKDITRSVGTLHASIDEQAASVVESSASIEEMIANIGSVAESIRKVDEVYESLLTSAEAGKRKISESNTLIARVSEMSKLLLEANQVIAGIASKTNLLAMNAAIEAAHAGESGKGFSVVADEIRNLAERSAVQSKEIGSKLKEIKESIDHVVNVSGEAELSFDEVAGLIGQVSDIENGIRNAMDEQSAGSRQVLEALGAMNAITERVKEGARDMSEGTKAVLEDFRILQDRAAATKRETTRITEEIEDIGKAFFEVSRLIEQTAVSIDSVTKETARFTI